MRDRMIASFIATSGVLGTALMVTGLVIMYRENKKYVRIHAADAAFHQQMKDYEFDTQRRNESIKFWKQIIDDDLV